MSEPLQPGLFIDGRGRICELREVGGTWQHPSTTTEPQCLTYPPERLYTESQVRAQVEAARQDTLNQAADDLDEFAATVYATDIFITPTKEQYAEINALLKRERGHQLDGVAADCYRRAITVQANRLREMAADIDDDLLAARGETRQS